MFGRKLILSILSMLLFMPFIDIKEAQAGTATVTAIVRHADGSLVTVAGNDVSCIGSAMIDGNHETILAKGWANGNGVATITIDDPFNDQITIRCSISESIAYSGCIQQYSYSPATFIAKSGTNTTVKITQKNACAYSQPAPEPAQPSNPAPIVEEEKQPEMAAISKITLPDEYLVDGSATTDFSDLEEEDSKCVKNVVLENPEKGKIEFSECLDLSSDDIAKKFSKLNEHIVFEAKGISLNEIDELNKNAKVTLYDKSFVSEEFDYQTIDENGDIKLSKGIFEDGEAIIEFEKISSFTILPGLSVYSYDSKVGTDSVSIQGQVNLLSASVIIAESNKYIEIKDDGSFETTLSLKEGGNSFTVLTVFDGEEIESEMIKVEYTPLSRFEEFRDSESSSTYIGIGLLLGSVILIGLAGGSYYFISKKKK